MWRLQVRFPIINTHESHFQRPVSMGSLSRSSLSEHKKKAQLFGHVGRSHKWGPTTQRRLSTTSLNNILSLLGNKQLHLATLFYWTESTLSANLHLGRMSLLWELKTDICLSSCLLPLDEAHRRIGGESKKFLNEKWFPYGTKVTIKTLFVYYLRHLLFVTFQPASRNEKC